MRAAIEPTGSLDGMRILVVEDSPAVRSLLTTLLNLEGADVVQAANGRTACDVLDHGEFDVAVSDLGLPDVPGEVLVSHIRSVSRGRTRVAVLSGAGEPFLSRARAAGADRVFTKPLDWGLLLRYLRHGTTVAA